MADNPYSWMDLFEAGMPQYVDPPQPASGGVAPPPAAKPVKAPIKKLAFKKTTANPTQFSPSLNAAALLRKRMVYGMVNLPTGVTSWFDIGHVPAGWLTDEGKKLFEGPTAVNLRDISQEEAAMLWDFLNDKGRAEFEAYATKRQPSQTK